MERNDKESILINLLENCRQKLHFYNLNSYDCGMLAVLRMLYENGSLFANQLSHKLNVSRARLSSIIKSLLKKNYINVAEDKNDKRKIMLSLNENGREYLTNIQENEHKKLKDLIVELGEEKVSKIINSLSDIDQLLKTNKEGKVC